MLRSFISAEAGQVCKAVCPDRTQNPTEALKFIIKIIQYHAGRIEIWRDPKDQFALWFISSKRNEESIQFILDCHYEKKQPIIISLVPGIRKTS